MEGWYLDSVGEDEFVRLCRAARERGFTLMQGDIESEESVGRVYRGYLAEGYGVRFMLRGLILPHVKAKLAATSLHRRALAGSVRVVVNEAYTTRISPLELQVAYKLYLATDKDVGDAVFLYTLFKNAINTEELSRRCGELGVDCEVLEAGEP